MKYGVSIANIGLSSDPKDYGGLAKAVEEAGWDGFFLWDHVNLAKKGYVADPWIALAAVAMNTERLFLGPMVVALPRRHPYKVACEVATLDTLSDGRVIFGVGLGWLAKKEFIAFGEPGGVRSRAEKCDEALEVITGLWTGEPYSFKGKHYQVKNVAFRSLTQQKPRVPIWVGGTWPKKGPFRRAARYEGVIPVGVRDPQKFKEMVQFVQQQRTLPSDYDFVCGSSFLSNTKRQEFVEEYRHVGATWFLESWGLAPLKTQLKRVKRGPPK